MFLSRNKKNNVYPYKPHFYYIKVGFKGGQNYIGMFSWCNEISNQVSHLRSLIRVLFLRMKKLYLSKMHKLIWIFAPHTCPTVCFLMLRLRRFKHLVIITCSISFVSDMKMSMWKPRDKAQIYKKDIYCRQKCTINFICNILTLSNTILPARLHVRSATTQISLRVRGVWSSLGCPHKDPWLPTVSPAKTLIRLLGCAGCSGSSSGARAARSNLSRVSRIKLV